MRLNELGDEAETAARLMADAARLARRIQVEAGSVRAKADESPVTIVDFAVQAVVSHRLAARFPDDPLVAEEDAAALKDPAAGTLLSRVVDAVHTVAPGLTVDAILDAIDRGRGDPAARFWTLDPIDGTKGLLRGGQYVVALALIVKGEVQVGAIGCPRLSLTAIGGPEGGVALAVRGRGSWWVSLDADELLPLGVSTVSDAAGVRVAHSVEESHSDLGRLEAMRTALGSQVSPVLMDSQAKHVMVAAGEADVLVRFPRDGYREAIWDQAAGALIIEEAGGRVTDLAGRRLDFSTGRRLVRNDGLVASNGRLHEALLRALSPQRPA
ncbi:MAG TPA: 3'(2'),5'-bisphosphate nucleotidase [Vicinamibacterales bacterium]|nr:3'(2'),5'-bisphosphate nucleotidase [Vicinamibacterales bacterium]